MVEDSDPMSEDALYDDLPDDPELAFLKLESFFKKECEKKLRNDRQNEKTDIIYVEYIGKVLAAINELGLSKVVSKTLPDINNVDSDIYISFSMDVDHYTTALRIRLARRTKGFSVRLDAATKQRIRHHIEQVRELIIKLEIEDRRREDLLVKLDAFGKEVDRDRTRYEAFGALIIEAAEVFGEAAEKAEPARKWLDTIGRLIWGARKEEDEIKHLPSPKETKQIEPQKVKR